MKIEATEYKFTHLFQEWMLINALSLSIKGENIWKEFPFHINNKTVKLSEYFKNSAKGIFQTERILEKEEYGFWGIDKDTYQQSYWFLRPDFMIIDINDKSLFIIEAKGGSSIPVKTWDNPKELKYCGFLEEAKEFDKKGFLYIVPKYYEENCIKCIEKHFNQNKIMTGYGIWEEMLEFISDSINTTFIDWLIFQSEGIKKLREWKKNLNN